MKIIKQNKVLTSQSLNAEMIVNENIRKANENARNVFEVYDNLKQYVAGNKVFYNGSSYVNKISCIGIVPTNTTYFNPLALKGDDGTMLVPKGTYVSATTYIKDNLVNYNTSVWQCLQTVTGVAPIEGVNWTAFLTGGGAIGDLGLLKTTSKTTAVDAINENHDKIGILTTLTTVQKISLVSAINEHDLEIGNLTLLTTTSNTDLVSSLVEINANKLAKTGESSDNTVSFTESTTDSDIISGEKQSILFGKILKSIKSIKNEFVDVKNFGAKGNGSNDDTASIQNALNSLTRPSVVFFPDGQYRITSHLILPIGIIVYIKGTGMYSSTINYFETAIIESVFDTVDGNHYSGLSFEDIGIYGGNKSKCGIRCVHGTHTIFNRVMVQQSTQNAIVWNGYCNTFRDCQILSNLGNGISAYGINNNLLITGTKIYANDGWGITCGADLEAGLGIDISNGNNIEGNKAGGIVLNNIKSYNICNNYFERNAELGFSYSTPESITIRSDIHILASSTYQIDKNEIYKCDTGMISGNHFTPYASGSAFANTDSFIFTSYACRLKVTNNQVYDITKINGLVSLYNNRAYSKIESELEISNNSTNSIIFVGSFDANTQHYRYGHLINTSETMSPNNYAMQNFLMWDLFSGSSGAFKRDVSNFKGSPVFNFTVGDSVYGGIIDLVKNPELKGKYVWFGIWFNTVDTASDIRLLFNGQSESSTTAETLTGGWKFKSICKKIDITAVNIVYTIQKIGSGSNVLVSYPILSVVGDGVSKFPISKNVEWRRNDGVTGVGYWNVGDVILNNHPVVGNPKSWICTVAGEAPTWVSQGNL